MPRDFDELANCMLGIGSHFSPSELHGAVVGALAGAMRLARDEWAAFAYAVSGAEVEPASVADSAAAFGGLAEQELRQLAGSDLAFRLFLPDDDYDIEQRTESLASWCKGFLGGFAEARSRSTGASVQDPRQGLPEAVVESLQDMAAIAQASVAATGAEGEDDIDEDELFDDNPIQVPMQRYQAEALSGDELEAAERDYTEVSEYLRLAALTVFTEYGWVDNAGNGDPNRGDAAPGSPTVLH
ncbi:MAG: UPF0149 family protein [Gammaproteobacteria bacterium]|nr:UPF0149 family protein [Gammaproteobacteria bacterium]MBT8149857.1 UPF0149 family protein [Gammaproteobacteria bacterium]